MRSRRPRFPRLAAIVLAGLLAGATCLIAWQIHTRVSAGPAQSPLHALERERLFYPGAVVLAEASNNAEINIGGRVSASATYLVGVNAEAEAVIDFYNRELPKRGWVYSPRDAAVGTTEVTGTAYRNGDLALQLSVLKAQDPQNPGVVRPYTAPYRLTIIQKPRVR